MAFGEDIRSLGGWNCSSFQGLPYTSPHLGSLNQQRYIPHSSEGQKSKFRVLEGWFSLEAVKEITLHAYLLAFISTGCSWLVDALSWLIDARTMHLQAISASVLRLLSLLCVFFPSNLRPPACPRLAWSYQEICCLFTTVKTFLPPASKVTFVGPRWTYLFWQGLLLNPL